MKTKNILKTLLRIALIWSVLTTTICRFKNPKKTETELLMSVPKSFILNFN